jgi:PhoPQ-activated pathogenicity-related protein
MKAEVFSFSQESQHQNSEHRLVQSMKKRLALLVLFSTTTQTNAHSAHISCKYNFKNIHNYIEKGEHAFSINPLEESIIWTNRSSRFRPQSKGELFATENPYIGNSTIHIKQ